MKKIDKIRIKNFKAFPVLQEFDLNGKNLLVYGNNGSGKSSLYWALYTLLQSSEKTVNRVNEYFAVYDDTNPQTFQSLRNVFSLEDESIVEIELEGEAPIRISEDNIASAQTISVKEANKASDFINYKLLHNFYNSTHKNQLNLWEVFDRDVFPYFSYSGKTFEEILKDIKNNLPRYSVNGKFYRRNSHAYLQYQQKIQSFNTELTTLVSSIQNQANKVLKEKFRINDVEVVLEYIEKISWDKNYSRFFNDPQIKLDVKIKKGDAFISNHRPQSFLNEASLTRIAISIRLGALFIALLQANGKYLC